MKAYHIGFFIRQKRKELNIKQESLCQGVCDHSTLSRIERGKHEPSISVLKALLQRLGVDEDQFSIFLGPKDFETTNLQKEIIALNAQKQFEQAAEKIDRLEKLADPEDKVVQQFILRSKALVLPEKDYFAKRELLTKALRITYSDFDFDHIGDYLLSVDEVKILNQIAITYSETGERRYAINIYRQLFESPYHKAVNDEARVSVMPILAYNYSRLLGLERRYEEEIEVAQLGYEICIKHDKCRRIGDLILNIACGLHELGQDEQSKAKLTDAYYFYRIIQDYDSCKLVKQYAHDTFGMVLDK